MHYIFGFLFFQSLQEENVNEAIKNIIQKIAEYSNVESWPIAIISGTVG